MAERIQRRDPQTVYGTDQVIVPGEARITTIIRRADQLTRPQDTTTQSSESAPITRQDRAYHAAVGRANRRFIASKYGVGYGVENP